MSELIGAAKAAGGKDNASVVVCRILDQVKDECEVEDLSFNDTTAIQ